MMGGICKDDCSADGAAVDGAFFDCTDRQECCVKTERTDKKKTGQSDR